MCHLVRPSRIISNQMSMKRQMLCKCLLFYRSCTPVFLLFGLRGSHQTTFQTAGSRAGVPPLASFWHRGDNRSVCALKLCVVTHVRSSASLCPAALLDLSHEVKEGSGEGAACLMWVTWVSFSLFFTVDPGQSVEPEGVRVFTQQTESGRE